MDTTPTIWTDATARNASRVADTLWKNYAEQILSNRRFADRSQLILAGSITLIGVMMSVRPSSPAVNLWSPATAFFAIGLAALVMTMVLAFQLWRGQECRQPLQADKDTIMQTDVYCAESEMYDNLIRGLCVCLTIQREVTEKLSTNFFWFFTCDMIAILCFAIAELIG